MPTIRYTGGGRYRVAGTTFEHGDTADVSDEQAAHLTDDAPFETVVDVDYDVHEEGTPAADPPLNPAEFSVNELRAALDEGDYSDAELDAIADAEASSDDRTTAQDAINAARER